MDDSQAEDESLLMAFQEIGSHPPKAQWDPFEKS